MKINNMSAKVHYKYITTKKQLVSTYVFNIKIYLTLCKVKGKMRLEGPI